jgi:hypothetical protein
MPPRYPSRYACRQNLHFKSNCHEIERRKASTGNQSDAPNALTFVKRCDLSLH